MIEPVRTRPSEDGLAAVAGGAVTRDRLQAASNDGASHALVRSLIAQGLPRAEDLARVFSAWGSALRLEPRFLRPDRVALQRVGLEWMDEQRCLPVLLLDGVAVVAVVSGTMETAATCARERLGCDVIPVPVAAHELSEAIDSARRSLRARTVFRRFREIAIERRVQEETRS
jgi:hypothetical protein